MINGRSGAGKDEIANHLVSNYGFTQVSFATPIYIFAREFFGMTAKDRKLLQDIGQSWRNINPDVWVNYLFKNLPDGNIVISDCRQANEIIEGMKNWFIPIRVSASLENRINRIVLRDGAYPDVSLFDNESESGADDFPYIEVNNDGTKQELYEKIDSIINGFVNNTHSELY